MSFTHLSPDNFFVSVISKNFNYFPFKMKINKPDHFYSKLFGIDISMFYPISTAKALIQ